MKCSALCLGLWAALTFASPVFAIGSNFSYQGTLQDVGVAANGSYDLEFRLQTQAGLAIGSPVLKDNDAATQALSAAVFRTKRRALVAPLGAVPSTAPAATSSGPVASVQKSAMVIK